MGRLAQKNRAPCLSFTWACCVFGATESVNCCSWSTVIALYIRVLSRLSSSAIVTCNYIFCRDYHTVDVIECVFGVLWPAALQIWKVRRRLWRSVRLRRSMRSNLWTSALLAWWTFGTLIQLQGPLQDRRAAFVTMPTIPGRSNICVCNKEISLHEELKLAVSQVYKFFKSQVSKEVWKVSSLQSWFRKLTSFFKN